MSLNYKNVLKRLQDERWQKVLEICGHKIRPWGRVLLLALPWDEDGDFLYFPMRGTEERLNLRCKKKEGRKMTDCIGIVADDTPSDVVKELKEGR